MNSEANIGLWITKPLRLKCFFVMKNMRLKKPKTTATSCLFQLFVLRVLEVFLTNTFSDVFFVCGLEQTNKLKSGSGFTDNTVSKCRVLVLVLFFFLMGFVDRNKYRK